MRRALHSIAILIGDAFHGNQDIAAVRLHDLDLLTHRELVLLLNAAAAILPYFFYRAEIGVVLDVGVAVVDLAVGGRLSEVKTGGKFPIGAFANFRFVPFHIFLVQGRILLVIIDGLAIRAGHGCHIECGLHATLDLEAVDTGIDQLRNVLDHAQILGVENVGAALILVNRHILTRSGLLHNRVFPTARMGAGTLVGISSHQEIAQQAAAGIGNAHSSVNEALNLHILRNVGTDLLDFL